MEFTDVFRAAYLNAVSARQNSIGACTEELAASYERDEKTWLQVAWNEAYLAGGLAGISASPFSYTPAKLEEEHI
jgi:hypothetical protein